MLRFWVGMGVDSKAYTKIDCGVIMGYQAGSGEGLDQSSEATGTIDIAVSQH